MCLGPPPSVQYSFNGNRAQTTSRLACLMRQSMYTGAMQVQIDICVLRHSMGCCPLDQCCQDARQQHIQLDERWLTYYPRHCKSALGEQFTCVVWDREALKGRVWDRTASPSTISVSMMVSWKYASRETASTCAEASARVCHSTTLICTFVQSRNIYPVRRRMCIQVQTL